MMGTFRVIFCIFLSVIILIPTLFAIDVPGWLGVESRGGGIAVGYINDDKIPDVVIFSVDKQGRGETAYLKVGFNIRDDGTAEYWANPIPIYGMSINQIAAADISIADINKNGRPDIVIYTIENSKGGNKQNYRIGWDIDTKGTIVNWDSHLANPIKIPGWVGEETQGGGIAIGDINRNGTPDLLVFHIDHPDGGNKGYYKIGWDFTKEGELTWDSRSRVDQPFNVPGWFGEESQGGDIAITDLYNNSIPDLVVLHIDHPDSGNTAYYRIGWEVSKEGNVKQWDEQVKIDNWVGDQSVGCGIDQLSDYKGLGKNFVFYTSARLLPHAGESVVNKQGGSPVYYTFPITWGRTTFENPDNSRSSSFIEEPGRSTFIPDSDSNTCSDPSMKVNTNFPGKDYKNLDLSTPNPCECRDLCTNDPKCRAYTYVKPGVQGEKARCWLKLDVPAQVQSNDCISGVNNMGEGLISKCSDSSMELNTDRPGKDYKDLDLSTPDPCECRDLCTNDPKCRAYTYVKPGVQGEKARCWLKSEVPEPVQSNDCISGVNTKTTDYKIPLTPGIPIITGESA